MPRRKPSPQWLPPYDLLPRLGTRLRAHRAARGWTLAELAHRSQISQRFLSDLEAGKANVSVLNLHTVASVLGTSAAALLQLEDEKPADRRGVVALIGLRGAGKSTVGPKLAGRLSLPFFELDGLIEADAGLPLSEIFAVHGEAWYRRRELAVLQRFLDRHAEAVLATGGGIVTAAEAFQVLLGRCTTVWLKAKPGDHLDRVLKQGDERPTAGRANAIAELKALLAEREPLYSRAEIAVDTAALGVTGAVETLARRIRGTA
jgi:XRE family aerobic/anaerobic benzoate catabolism transcriptional regulator